MSDIKNQKNKKSYRVLARKYRPVNFDELIGQDAMVRTLSNAIESNRLAHAFILTGVRGVGKTTTARIIAKALNCIGKDGQGSATINPCGFCDNCVAISESRHVDVLEMDAASRTGVDDVREIIDGVQYAATSARFKIYIIDEIHMLTRNAFNALLKTLEEPPAHVKFIFATTEIRKVPVTVLSRCQRFDLKRVTIERLNVHFKSIMDKESCTIDEPALNLISRAAEGSVRDGLSLLDQAIAHGAGRVDETQVREMLGLADRAGIIDLYKFLMQGDIQNVLTLFKSQYNLGADPAVILSDMIEFTHWLTRLKVMPQAGEDVVTSEIERSAGQEMIQNLSMLTLSRTWQMLLKGLEETRQAPHPFSAAEMIFIRIAYAADLPSPEDLVKKLKDTTLPSATPQSSQTSGHQISSIPQETSQKISQPNKNTDLKIVTQTPLVDHSAKAEEAHQETISKSNPHLVFDQNPEDFKQLVHLFYKHNEASIVFHLSENAHLVSFKAGKVDIKFTKDVPKSLTHKIAENLKKWTGHTWVIAVSQGQGDKSLYEQELKESQALKKRLSCDPLIQAVLSNFEGSKITAINKKIPC